MNEHIEDDTLCRTDIDPTIVERPIVHHVTNNFIDDGDGQLSHQNTISSFLIYFNKTDVMFLEFVEDLDNPTGGHCRWVIIWETCVVLIPEVGALHSCEWEDFDVYHPWFVEHQMLSTFKEFRGYCHRHFKKYSDPREARANPPHILVRCIKDWHYLCDHYMSLAFQGLYRVGGTISESYTSLPLRCGYGILNWGWFDERPISSRMKQDFWFKNLCIGLGNHVVTNEEAENGKGFLEEMIGDKGGFNALSGLAYVLEIGCEWAVINGLGSVKHLSHRTRVKNLDHGRQMNDLVHRR
ncbi:gamma-aminobutyrate transaminase POP2 [Cucumis melo var. makuwa]|uniref:Gamma-aminobutyrate transaminase POP2 n=1 Tax=Cucumis melo var. makuwa TaxID=1194695 RepID=A0A5D3C0N6_CUCMM|nr:gamma-aminobutyrate transaminase POP2 [Cucumis melo var. makuwa]